MALNKFEKDSAGEKPRPISAAGGVLYRSRKGAYEVLLIYRRGVWDLPKGKLDDGETIRECAVREVSEEVGCPGPDITHDLGTTVHIYKDKWGHFEKTTWWYAMQTDAQHFSPEQEEDITKVCWVNLEKAFDMVGFENLKEVLSRFKNVLKP